MTYPEKEISESIINRLKTNSAWFTDHNHTPPVHYQWYQEEDTPEGEKSNHPYDRPAIKIEFGEIRFETEKTKGYARSGVAPVTVHVERENYVDNYEGSENKSDHLDLLEYHHLVNQLLEGWRGICAKPLHLVTISPDHNSDNRMIHKLNYEVRFTMKRPSDTPD